MFVEASVPVALPADQARTALIAAVTGDGLVAESSHAYAEGLATLREVGTRHLRRQVQVKTLPSRQAGETTILPIRWEAFGVTGELFPALDADLCLTPVNDVTCVLSIIGCYDPPLGGVGRAIDRTLLAGTAQSSVNDFVRGVSAAMREIAIDRANRLR